MNPIQEAKQALTDYAHRDSNDWKRIVRNLLNEKTVDPMRPNPWRKDVPKDVLRNLYDGGIF